MVKVTKVSGSVIKIDDNITVRDMHNGIIKITQRELGETQIVFLSKKDIQAIVSNLID